MYIELTASTKSSLITRSIHGTATRVFLYKAQVVCTRPTCYSHSLLCFQKLAISLTIKIVFYCFKESRQNSTVEEDSEGDNDSEEFYYGGQVSTSVPPNIYLQREQLPLMT